MMMRGFGIGPRKGETLLGKASLRELQQLKQELQAVLKRIEELERKVQSSIDKKGHV